MESWLGLVWIQIQIVLSFSKPSQMELVWKLQILPHNYINLNSYSGSLRQMGILEDLLDFSKHVWPPIISAQIQKQFFFLEF
jgi:hypothetical protein